MKKIFYYTAILTGLLLSSTSCEDSNASLPDEGVGSLIIELQKDKEPSVPTTKTMEVDVDKFVIVGIPGFNGTYADFKKKGTLEIAKGTYPVSAHSPGEMQVASAEPFFSGKESVTINADEVRVVNIVCAMMNAKVKLNVSNVENFFKDGSLNVSIRKGKSEGENQSHSFNIQNGITEDWYFAPTNGYEVVITGKTIDDLDVSSAYDLNLEKAANVYLEVIIKGPDTKSSILRRSDFNIKVTTVE